MSEKVIYMEDQDEFVESLEYIPENFVNGLDVLPEEPGGPIDLDKPPEEEKPKSPEPATEEGDPVTTEPESAEPASTEVVPTGTEDKEKVDTEPAVDYWTLKADLDEIKEKFEKVQKQAGYWQRQAEKALKAPAPAPEVEAKPKPNIDDFDDVEAYQEALVDWRVDQKITQYETARTSQATAGSELSDADFASKLIEDGSAKFEDFQETVLSETVPITAAIMDLVRGVDDPASLVYYLAKSPKDLVRLNRLARADRVGAAREIGELVSKIDVEGGTVTVKESPKEPVKPKKVSAAPPPISPVRASSGTVSKDPSRMTNEEYRKWRMGKKG